jgi:polar amino acid transport system substrate-binding protein
MAKYGKFVALLAVAALAVSALALGGCSSQPATSSTPAETSAAAPATPSYTLVNAGTLTAGSDTAFPPFETMNGTTVEGFDVDLIDAIAKDMGVKSEFKSVKFDTLIPQLVAGGKFDIVASAMTITDERKQQIDFTDPYIDSNQSLSVKKGSSIKSTADLSGKTVGVQSGTTGEAWAKENLKKSKIVPFDDTLAAFSALQAGKVDGIINDLPVSAYIVKDAARNAAIVQEIPTGEQYGFAVAKTNPGLATAINASLTKLKADGTYNAIYKKWFGVEPAK